MSINKKFVDKFINVSAKAALSSFYLVGKKDKISADKAAVDAMRFELNKMDIKGTIVIGEGELDEAPMLYIGEEVGNKKGPELDIAVDPLEGTNFVANNFPGALAVLAVAEKNNLFNAPETYMDKISTRVKEKNVIDLDFPVKKNISNLSDYLNKKPEDLTACLLDRPRHKKIINELNDLGVKLKLITDGDVSGALMVTDDKYNVDIFLGIGGGPEGVLAAAALDAYDCSFQGRFLFETDEDKSRAKKMGINDLNKKYSLHELVSKEAIFSASGVTDGSMLSGVKFYENKIYVETLVMRSNSGTIRHIKTEYNNSN